MGARNSLSVVDVVENVEDVAVAADVVDRTTVLQRWIMPLLLPRRPRITQNLTKLKNSRWVMHSPLLLLPSNLMLAALCLAVDAVTTGFNGFVVVVVAAISFFPPIRSLRHVSTHAAIWLLFSVPGPRPRCSCGPYST
jgi:hypothetical protein